MATINNNSDIAITCGVCGLVFSGNKDCWEELAKMFGIHKENES